MRFLLIAISLLVISSSFSVRADELDGDKTISTEQIRLASALPKAVVVRVKAGTNQTEIFHSRSAIPANDAVKLALSTSSFIKLDAQGKMVGELDNDSSSSSWRFWCPTGYYPTYYYYGYVYNYSSYYSYYYGGYQYSYYRWPYWY